jgi:hypothetical protein
VEERNDRESARPISLFGSNMKLSHFALGALVLAVAVTSLDGWAQARKKDAAKQTKAVPARVHFSGNFQGELEPCG